MSVLSEKVLKVTVEYIGPSAERFLERQTAAHLNGLAFKDLGPEHLPELSKWVNTSAGLLVGKDKAAELAGKIAKM